jgi:hypothetical protein
MMLTAAPGRTDMDARVSDTVILAGSHMPAPGVPKVRRRAGDGATAGTPPLRCAPDGAPLRRVGRPLGHRTTASPLPSRILRNPVGATVRGLRRAPSGSALRSLGRSMGCLRPGPPAERFHIQNLARSGSAGLAGRPPARWFRGGQCRVVLDKRLFSSQNAFRDEA